MENSEIIISKTIINFIKNDINCNINLKLFNKEKHENNEKIIEVYKYNLILTKLKSFNYSLLLDITKNKKKTLIENEINKQLRQDIFDFSHNNFDQTNYSKNLLLIKNKYKIVLKEFETNFLIGHLLKLLKYVDFLLKDNMVSKINRNSLNDFISKFIFYTSVIILYLS